MARYFKYKSLDELAAACRDLALDLRFCEDITPLFRPVRVGSLTVGNTLCVQPMEGCDGTLDGRPDELTFRRFERFGEGGAKLIWGEAAAVVDEGRANSRQLCLTDANASAFERLARTCHDAHWRAIGRDDDFVLGLQLTHSGRYSYRRPLLAWNDPLVPTRPDAVLLDDAALGRLPDRFARAARLARECGFQFVDIKQCHRYLLCEMLSAHDRPGPYGGSFENRTRLGREIFQAIRAETPDLLLATRLNVFDGLPYRRRESDGVGEPVPWTAPVRAWGTDPADPHRPDLSEVVRWIEELTKLGVGLLNVSLGNPYASPHLLRPFEYPPPDGYETPEHPLVGVDRHVRLTAEIQRRFPDLPIVGSGYSYLQEFLFHAGAANVAEGRTTFVGVGRASLAQPDFARQLLEHGKLDRRRVCRTFSYCTALMRSKHNELGQFATGCPPFDKDVYGPIWKDAESSRPRPSS